MLDREKICVDYTNKYSSIVNNRAQMSSSGLLLEFMPLMYIFELYGT